MSSGVTGENLHVDSGYHIVVAKAEDAPDIDVVTGRGKRSLKDKLPYEKDFTSQGTKFIETVVLSWRLKIKDLMVIGED